VILTWGLLAETDPRLADLEAAACDVARRGEPDVSVDDIYAEAKRHATSLVGWRRGMPTIPHQRRPGDAEMEARFAPIVRHPSPAPDPAWMYDGAAYQVAVVHLFDAICDAAEVRARASDPYYGYGFAEEFYDEGPYA
jgi:hypothetical protein